MLTIQISHASSAVSLCMRPDGEQVAVSCLDGIIHLVKCSDATEEGSIIGKGDLSDVFEKTDSANVRVKEGSRWVVKDGRKKNIV